MSKDMIYKQSALDILDDFQSDIENGTPHAYSMARQRMLGLYPRNPKWIPCSERLPNYREVVLISTFWGVRMAERDSVKEDGTDDFWYLFLDDATARPMYVYAWMPLPEPWKEADDDNN